MKKSNIPEELEILLKGRVQGVGLRKKIKGFADNSGLRGFVVNEEEGSVRVLIQGERKSLTVFNRWINTNPGVSFIKNIEKVYEGKKRIKKYKSFTINKKESFFKDQFKSFFNLLRYFFRFSFFQQNNSRIPVHVVIIPDGNRRWAKKRGLKKVAGHEKSARYENILSLFNEAKKLGVKYVSFWGFSTENWRREKEERDFIFGLILKILEKLRKDFHKDKVGFRHFGRRDRLPLKLVRKIEKIEEETKKYNNFGVQLCLDYGGRDEILRAVNRILKSGNRGKKISEKDFLNYLDSKGIPDPDLIIRTSGEKRLSGLMPFQSVYSELYFTKKPFPLFDAGELRKAVREFGKRKRRFGGD